MLEIQLSVELGSRAETVWEGIGNFNGSPEWHPWVESSVLVRARLQEGSRLDKGDETALSLMILVAGPYRSGTNDDPALIAANVSAMTETALRLFRAGHLPVLGEWFALPLIEVAGSKAVGDAVFDEIFHPISRRLIARCDACLRIGGPSKGADEMVALARAQGKPVFFRVEDVSPKR